MSQFIQQTTQSKQQQYPAYVSRTAPKEQTALNLTKAAGGPSGLLTMYSLTTPPEIFDIRCEYEVPRYFDLNSLDEDEDEGGFRASSSSGHYDMSNGGTGNIGANPGCTERIHSTTGGATVRQQISQEDEFFQWFQLSHDFQVNKRFVKVSKETIVSQVQQAPQHQQIVSPTTNQHRNEQRKLQQQVRQASANAMNSQPETQIIQKQGSTIKHTHHKSTASLANQQNTITDTIKKVLLGSNPPTVHHQYSNSTLCQTERNPAHVQQSVISPPSTAVQMSKCKTSRNQLQRTQSQALTNQQMLSVTSTSKMSGQNSGASSKPQPSFIQVLQPKVSQPQIVLSKQKSTDFTKLGLSTHDLLSTQQHLRVDQDFVERLFSKNKRTPNASVDLLAGTHHQKNKSNPLMSQTMNLQAALKTTRDHQDDCYLIVQNNTQPDLASGSRGTSTNKRTKDVGAVLGCQSSRINFIEHNKQRVKLMSANSRSRVPLMQPSTDQPSSHHQHSQSISNLNICVEGAVSTSQTRPNKVQSSANLNKNGNLSRNNKSSTLMTGPRGLRQSDLSASMNLNMSFTTTTKPKQQQPSTIHKPLLNQVLGQILESSTNKHVNQPDLTRNETKVNAAKSLANSLAADVDPKRKRNNRVNSFVWTNSMSVHSSSNHLNHSKNQSMMGPLATQICELKTLSDAECTPLVNERKPKKDLGQKENSQSSLMAQTQSLYQMLSINDLRVCSQKVGGTAKSNSRQQNHQRNQTQNLGVSKVGLTQSGNSFGRSFLANATNTNVAADQQKKTPMSKLVQTLDQRVLKQSSISSQYNHKSSFSMASGTSFQVAQSSKTPTFNPSGSQNDNSLLLPRSALAGLATNSNSHQSKRRTDPKANLLMKTYSYSNL